MLGSHGRSLEVRAKHGLHWHASLRGSSFAPHGMQPAPSGASTASLAQRQTVAPGTLTWCGPQRSSSRMQPLKVAPDQQSTLTTRATSVAARPAATTRLPKRFPSPRARIITQSPTTAKISAARPRPPPARGEHDRDAAPARTLAPRTKEILVTYAIIGSGAIRSANAGRFARQRVDVLVANSRGPLP